ncbi:hypothetical protein YPPY54_1221, partial [Yersinia pestis PY-54]
MNVNASHEQTSKNRIVHQIQPIGVITEINIIRLFLIYILYQNNLY